MPKKLPVDPKLEKIQAFLALEPEKMNEEEAKGQLKKILNFFQESDFGPKLYYCRYKPCEYSNIRAENRTRHERLRHREPILKAKAVSLK